MPKPKHVANFRVTDDFEKRWERAAKKAKISKSDGARLAIGAWADQILGVKPANSFREQLLELGK